MLQSKNFDASRTDLLIDHVVERIISKSKKLVEPFPTFHVTDFFPKALIDQLCKLDVAPVQMTGARAHNNATRVYFTSEFQKKNPVAALVCSIFQHPQVVSALAQSSEGDLQNTHLLAELTVDTGKSSLVPHRDIGPKRFTGLFFLSDDPHLADAGTDLYTPRADQLEQIAAIAGETGEAPREMFETETIRPVYASGNGYYFIPSNRSWHGFDERPINGTRKTIIINYLGPTKSGEVYRNTQNLAFPDMPVAF